MRAPARHARLRSKLQVFDSARREILSVDHRSVQTPWGSMLRVEVTRERVWIQGRREPEIWVQERIAPEDVRRLPRGVLAADPRRQIYGMGGHRLYYENKPGVCRDCGAAFVFTAREQRRWYEELRFSLDARAVRCAPCRARERRARVLHERLAARAHAREAGPPSAAAELAWCRAVVELFDETAQGRGQLPRALAAARRARRLSVHCHESWYWEGRVEELLERPDRAREAYVLFLERVTSRSGRLASLVADARTRFRAGTFG